MNKLERRQEAIKKANRVLRVWKSKGDYLRTNDEVIEREFHRLLKTRKVCSCYMCGNRRVWAGLTMQERKADLELSEG